MGDVILTMKGIDKSFPGVHALDHVDLEVRKGEVHALMGENGAGKSTLMKVLTGIYSKDSGTIIPGRGGILDSVDSIVMAAPVYIAILTVILGV